MVSGLACPIPGQVALTQAVALRICQRQRQWGFVPFRSVPDFYPFRACHSTLFQDPGFRIQDSGSWIQGSGSWIPAPEQFSIRSVPFHSRSFRSVLFRSVPHSSSVPCHLIRAMPSVPFRSGDATVNMGKLFSR